MIPESEEFKDLQTHGARDQKLSARPGVPWRPKDSSSFCLKPVDSAIVQEERQLSLMEMQSGASFLTGRSMPSDLIQLEIHAPSQVNSSPGIGVILSLVSFARQMYQRRKLRTFARMMSQLDDETLNDIGLSRGTLRDALALRAAIDRWKPNNR